MHPAIKRRAFDFYINSGDSPPPAPVLKRVGISFGGAAKAFAGTNWNFAHTASTSAYTLNNLKTLDGITLTGFNLVVTSVFSVQSAGGSNQACTGDADFPATICRDYWYPTSGSRVLTFQVPVGGFPGGLGSIKSIHNITIGTPPHVIDYTVGTTGGVTSNKTLTNGAGDPPTSAVVPLGNVLEWTALDFSANFTFTGNDNTGIDPVNAMIISLYV